MLLPDRPKKGEHFHWLLKNCHIPVPRNVKNVTQWPRILNYLNQKSTRGCTFTTKKYTHFYLGCHFRLYLHTNRYLIRFKDRGSYKEITWMSLKQLTKTFDRCLLFPPHNKVYNYYLASTYQVKLCEYLTVTMAKNCFISNLALTYILLRANEQRQDLWKARDSTTICILYP